MALLAAGSLLLALLAWRRTGKKDSTEAAVMDEQTRADLRYLVRNVDEIRADVRLLRDKANDTERRVTVIEESTKSAHKRLDEHIKMHQPA